MKLKHIANTILLLAVLLCVGCAGWTRNPQRKNDFVTVKRGGYQATGVGLGKYWNPSHGIPQTAMGNKISERSSYSSNGRTAVSSGQSVHQGASLIWDPATEQAVLVPHKPAISTWGHTNRVFQRRYGYTREVGNIRHSRVEGPPRPLITTFGGK